MIDPPTWKEVVPRLRTVNNYPKTLPFKRLLDAWEDRPMSHFQPRK